MVITSVYYYMLAKNTVGTYTPLDALIFASILATWLVFIEHVIVTKCELWGESETTTNLELKLH